MNKEKDKIIEENLKQELIKEILEKFGINLNVKNIKVQFMVDNEIMNDLINFVYLKVLQSQKQEFKDAVEKWIIDVDLDKIDKIEYPMFFKICEEINQRNKELLKALEEK